MQQTKKLMLAIVVMLISALSVSSQNVHLLKQQGTLDEANAAYCGKLAGLGDNQIIHIELHATATITTLCANHGTNPQNPVEAQTTRIEEVVASGDFASDKNGNVVFCLTLPEPTPGECPNPNWTATATATYTNAFLLVSGRRFNL